MKKNSGGREKVCGLRGGKIKRRKKKKAGRKEVRNGKKDGWKNETTAK